MEVAPDRVLVLAPEPDYRRVRPLKFLVLGITAVLIAWLVIFAIRASENALPGGSDEFAVGGTMLPLSIFGTIWVALGLGRGAESCRTTVSGFTLVYRSGRTTTFAWNDPKLRITVWELLSRGRLAYSISTRWPFLNPIPQELYLAILSEARARRLSVTEHTDTLSSGHQIKTRIRAAEQSTRS